MNHPAHYSAIIDQHCRNLKFNTHPKELYEPIVYMMQLGGKRLRPALLLMACEAYSGSFEHALHAAIGVEVFHNFTLLHDDIMDKAPLRRSKPTVHAKWNVDIAILSGDTMFVRACEEMLKIPDVHLRTCLEIFHKAATEVCEGQQLDMNFEQQSVSLEQYIEMIRLKTAVLLAASLQIGAVIGGANANAARWLYQFGEQLGIAFQLHDDILDLYGEASKVGKRIGGDVIANKKTWLLLKAIEIANNDQLATINNWMSEKEFDADAKVLAIKEIFNQLNIEQLALDAMTTYFNTAIGSLRHSHLPAEALVIFETFAKDLMSRQS